MPTNFGVPGITDPLTLLCLSRARNFKFYCRAVKEALANICTFCNIDPEVNRIVVENSFWVAWQSPVPDWFTKHHFIVVPKRHVIDSTELTKDEQLAWFNINKLLKNKYSLQGRGLVIRDGDARYLAGTIEHLHSHVIVPDGTGVVAPIFSKEKKAEKECFARAIIFEKLRQGAKLENLSKKERKIIEGWM